MRIEFTGKTLLITGGHGGIGSAICRCFAECGARVLAPSSREMNLAEGDSIDNYLDGLGCGVDLFVHCAGVNELAGVEETTRENMHRIFEVNLFSFVHVLRRIVPEMKRKKNGRIVGVSSLYGLVSRERRIPYSSSKHAMTGVIQSAALELAEDNVLINAVAPGYVMTEMTRKNLSGEEIRVIQKQIPTGRLQEAEEIAWMCAFLCSSFNQSITGQVIPVDGGFLCR